MDNEFQSAATQSSESAAHAGAIAPPSVIRAIEGDLLSKKKKKNPKATKQLTVRGHTFTPVIFGTGTLHKLSQREQKFLDTLLESGNMDLACGEIGIDPKLGARYLKRPAIRRYFEDQFKQRALARGVTIDLLMSELAQGISGTKEPTDKAIECMKLAAKILKPAGGGGVTVNVQNNVNVSSSPFAGLSSKELTAKMRERIIDVEAE